MRGLILQSFGSRLFSKNGSIFYRATTALLIAQLFGIEVPAAGAPDFADTLRATEL